MATIVEKTAPAIGLRMLLIGVASLLLGGVAGGLVSLAIQSGGESAAVPASAPVQRVSGSQFSFRDDYATRHSVGVPTLTRMEDFGIRHPAESIPALGTRDDYATRHPGDNG